MPELPEVESVRRGLELELIGRTITKVEVFVPKMLREPYSDPDQFAAKLKNSVVSGVFRRGKHLLFDIGNGYSLAAHLKMRGSMLMSSVGSEVNEKYLCFRIVLDNWREWRFYDIWTWGELRLLPVVVERASEFIPALATMGPEPLSEQFTCETFKYAARKRSNRSIKALLLDQDVVAGVGNIYADEALYRAGINPKQQVKAITENEWVSLHKQVRTVIGEAVALGGTISENFVDVAGNAGRYVPQVYGRHGEKCYRCGEILQRTIITGRGTAYCVQCQPLR